MKCIYYLFISFIMRKTKFCYCGVGAYQRRRKKETRSKERVRRAKEKGAGVPLGKPLNPIRGIGALIEDEEQTGKREKQGAGLLPNYHRLFGLLLQPVEIIRCAFLTMSNAMFLLRARYHHGTECFSRCSNPAFMFFIYDALAKSISK